ncbi:hypothetical protein CFOL_v3_24514 [Cephalotus follicularis]|uniref:Uncharacterized protein n=1 Tax=Cephalotus follicularis TaxID=3775 RepID=A0A1Q3CLJ8_CEPFO|nr:hypothetical protein CFOL_v3_24514 [Cephalotus follicularis]
MTEPSMAMGEPKPVQDQPIQTAEPQTTSTTPPPQPPPPVPLTNRKRPLDTNAQIQDTNYFKMRLVIKDLRPHILEVIRTSDFRDCEAAHEIREHIKLLMDLYKEMTVERVSIVNSITVPESLLSSGNNGVGKKPQEQPQTNSLIAKKSVNNPFQSGTVFDKQRPGDSEARGTYIIGGSAFGWNFITFTASDPVYYGVTKEAFRISQVNAGE